MHHPKTRRRLGASLLPLALAACCCEDPFIDGETVPLATTVIDGAVANAVVCLDLNDNGTCDATEPQGRTDTAGHVVIPVMSADLSRHAVVAMVGTDATDADHGPVPTAYTMSAPAGMSTVVSPLTTLVVETMRATGADALEAASSLKAATGLTASPFDDYTTAPPAGPVSAPRLSRMFVLTGMRILRTLAPAAGGKAADGSTITAADLQAAASRQLMVSLSDLVAAVTDPALDTKSAAEVETALGAAADTVAAASGLTADSVGAEIAIAKAPPEASAAPAAEVQLVGLNWTSPGNYSARMLTVSAAQASRTDGTLRFVDRRIRATGGTVAKWGTGVDPRRNADLHWNGSAWVACGPNFENTATLRDAAGNNRFDFCDGLNTGTSNRKTLDVGGQSMAAVLDQAAKLGYGGLAVADPAALGSATFPAGSKLHYQTNTDIATAIAYLPNGANSPAGTSSVVQQYSAAVAAGGVAADQPAGSACNAAETRGLGTSSTTLEAMIAAKSGTPCVYAQASFVYEGVTYSSDPDNQWWGNSVLALDRLGSAPLNSGPAPGFYSGNTLLRAAFTSGAANEVTYYACKERFTDGSTRNCLPIGTGTWAIATLGDARVLTMSHQPLAMATALRYERVVVERGGRVYFGYRSTLRNADRSARTNIVATRALLAQLGMEAEDPEAPLALTATSYQGTWDARDSAETSTTVGTTIFFSGDGSASCRDRATGVAEACTLTVTDPATGAFTLSQPDGSIASGTFDFMAGSASGSYHDPGLPVPDGTFVAFRR